MKPIQPPRGQQQQQFRPRSRERRDSQNRAGGDNQHQGRPQQRGRPNQGYNQNQGYHQNQGGYHQNQGGYNQYNRGGWPNLRGAPKGGQNNRGRPQKSGPFRPGAGGAQNQSGNNKKTLKFDSEYDFEQANTEFEELRNKLAKVKLDEASGTSKPEVNGAVGGPVEGDKKDDSGNETGAGETEQEEDHEVSCQKNFFRGFSSILQYIVF